MGQLKNDEVEARCSRSTLILPQGSDQPHLSHGFKTLWPKWVLQLLLVPLILSLLSLMSFCQLIGPRGIVKLILCGAPCHTSSAFTQHFELEPNTAMGPYE